MHQLVIEKLNCISLRVLDRVLGEIYFPSKELWSTLQPLIYSCTVRNLVKIIEGSLNLNFLKCPFGCFRFLLLLFLLIGVQLVCPVVLISNVVISKYISDVNYLRMVLFHYSILLLRGGSLLLMLKWRGKAYSLALHN